MTKLRGGSGTFSWLCFEHGALGVLLFFSEHWQDDMHFGGKALSVMED
jgi:hypothetical protein